MWKPIIITITLMCSAFDAYITSRQRAVLSRPNPPPVLATELSQDAFSKSQAYGRAKVSFSLWNTAYSQVLNVLFVIYDVLPRLWGIAGAMTVHAPARFSGEKSQSVVFLLVMLLAQHLLDLFPAWYSTFRLEAAFGFNKQTLGLWITDMLKSNLLVCVLLPPVVAGFLAIMQQAGDRFLFYVWLFIAVLQAFLITVYPIFILPLFNKLTPLENGPLKDKIEALAKSRNFPLDELLVIDGSKRSSHSNAYFSGLPWKKHIVLFDTLIEQSTQDEIVAVLAHELGHWELGHTIRLFLIAQVSCTCTHTHIYIYLANFALQAQIMFILVPYWLFFTTASMYRAFGFVDERPPIVGLVLFFDLLLPLQMVMKVTINRITRMYEFDADAFANRLGYAPDLARALIRLQIKNLSSMDVDRWYAVCNYSHPHLTERLKSLGWKPNKEDTPVVPAAEKEADTAIATGKDEHGKR